MSVKKWSKIGRLLLIAPAFLVLSPTSFLAAEGAGIECDISVNRLSSGLLEIEGWAYASDNTADLRGRYEMFVSKHDSDGRSMTFQSGDFRLENADARQIARSRQSSAHSARFDILLRLAAGAKMVKCVLAVDGEPKGQEEAA